MLRSLLRYLALSVTLGSLIGCGPVRKGWGAKTTINVEPVPTLQTEHAGAPEELPDPKDGESVVVVHVPDRDARVSEVLSSTSGALQLDSKLTSGSATGIVDLETRLLCARTPCTITLPKGGISVVVEAGDPDPGYESRRDIFDLQIGDNPTRVTHYMSRRNVSSTKRNTLPVVLEVIGIASMVGGASPFLAGVDEGSQFKTMLGGGIITAGALLVYLGYRWFSPGSVSGSVRLPKTYVQDY